MAIIEATTRRRRHPLLDDRLWLADQYLDQRLSIAAIAGELGCSARAVHTALRRHAIPVRPRPTTSIWAQERLGDRQWLEREFIEREQAVDDIAQQLHVSTSTVSLALRRHGIDTTRLTDRTRKRMAASARARAAVTPATRAKLSAGQNTRRLRERREREERERAVLEARDQERVEALENLGPDPTPAQRLVALLRVSRSHGVPFQDAWPGAVELALHGVKFQRMWREVLEDLHVKRAYRTSYLRLGKRLRIPDLFAHRHH